MTQPILPTSIEQAIQQIERSDMKLPVLLFLVAHQPAAFVAGQMLHLITPFVQMMGYPHCNSWAELLSSQQGITQLQQALDRNPHPRN